ncbi:MAG: hypothetical protein JSV80_08345 [Acidobacteriota bacterium]|nr:MAG: hypothetical protein JSV80_08345 [Acidobacteriota bacterium]
MAASPGLLADEEELPEGWKVLIRAGQMHGMNGIYFGPEDQLYIASVWGREIAKVDPSNGKILERLGPAQGVEAPDDLFVLEDGTIYHTAITSGDVIRISPDGDVKRQFVGVGVNPITFSDDGRLFVARDFFGDGLYELDPDLDDPPRRIIAGNLGWMNGMDWGPDGRLYGPIISQGLIASLDVDSCDETFDPWNDCDMELVADGFAFIAAVKFDSKGQLHAVSGQNVWRVDTATGSKYLVAQVRSSLDNLAFDSEDRLFVSNFDEGILWYIRPHDGPKEIIPGAMIAPGGVAVVLLEDGGDTKETLLIGDVFRLRHYTGWSGLELAEIGSGLSYHFTVASDGQQLVTSNWAQNLVSFIDLETMQIVDVDNTFSVPVNAIPFAGDTIVAELGTGKVVRRSDHLALATGLYAPTGLAGNDEDLFVADWATGVVWQLIDDGEILEPRRFIAAGLSLPEGMAFDVDGTLLVVETGARKLSRIDLENGGTVTEVLGGLEVGLSALPNAAPTFTFSDVAVSESGTIYVTGDRGNVVYRYKAEED